MWRACKAAGRPWPILDDDEVIDYQIMEAVAIKVSREDNKQEKKVEVDNWKRDPEGLSKLKEAARGG